MASTERARVRMMPPPMQLWTPPTLDAAAWRRLVEVVLGDGRDTGLVARSRRDLATASASPAPRIGLLLRLPTADDGAIAAHWRALHERVGRAARGHVALGLRLDGRIDAERLRDLGLDRWPCAWLHLAANASPVADVRAAWGRACASGEGPATIDGATELVVSRAAHDDMTVRRALAEGADALTLSPICATSSKPGQAPLGWAVFAELAALAPGRVWALGGLMPTDLGRARALHGGGVALLGGAWSTGEDAWPNLAVEAASSP